MALSTAAKLGLIGASVITAVGIAEGYKYYEHRRKKNAEAKKATVAEGLAGVYAPDEVFGNSGVADLVAFPIELSMTPDVFDPETGNVVSLGTNVIESAYPLAHVVTNLSPDAMLAVFEYMTHLVANKGYDLIDPPVRDKAIRETLMKWAPKVDWSQGLMPYTAGSAAYKTWMGVQTIGEIAAHSYWNKQPTTA